MQRHLRKNLYSVIHNRSISILKQKNKDQIPLIIKIETVLFLVSDSLSIPALFEKLLYALFRMNKSIKLHVQEIDTECLDIGDTCNSWQEGARIFRLLQQVIFKRLKFVISQPMNKLSSFKFVWYSLSFDGWMKSLVFVELHGFVCTFLVLYMI